MLGTTQDGLQTAHGTEAYMVTKARKAAEKLPLDSILDGDSIEVMRS